MSLSEAQKLLARARTLAADTDSESEPESSVRNEEEGARRRRPRPEVTTSAVSAAASASGSKSGARTQRRTRASQRAVQPERRSRRTRGANGGTREAEQGEAAAGQKRASNLRRRVSAPKTRSRTRSQEPPVTSGSPSNPVSCIPLEQKIGRHLMDLDAIYRAEEGCAFMRKKLVLLLRELREREKQLVAEAGDADYEGRSTPPPSPPPSTRTAMALDPIRLPSEQPRLHSEESGAQTIEHYETLQALLFGDMDGDGD